MDENCTDVNVMAIAVKKYEEQPYSTIPTVYQFINWYRAAAREAAGMPDKETCVTKIMSVIRGHESWQDLGPAVYLVYRECDVNQLVSGNYKYEDIERRIKRAYGIACDLIDKKGLEVLTGPPKALESGQKSEQEQHRENNRKRREGWKESKAFKKGVSELDKIRGILG